MRLLRSFVGFFAFTVGSLGVSLSVAGEDGTELGTQVFGQCQSCHEIGKDAVNRVGPHLNGVINRTIGGVPDFQYSDALAAAGQQGQTWDEMTLAQWQQSLIARTGMP